MAQVVIDFDPGAFSALRKAPAEFAHEVKMAAVLLWYVEGTVSESQAAEILGITRAALLAELDRRGILSSRETVEEIREGLRRARVLTGADGEEGR